jgi:hypothetical protein
MEESRGGEEDQFVEQYLGMILEAEVVKRVGIRKQFFPGINKATCGP